MTASHRPGSEIDAPRCPPKKVRDYTSFWNEVGSTFPSLKGAPSTDYYFRCERGLFEVFFPKLSGLILLKTDLWDEAMNTEILRWAAEQGARPVGIDLAPSIVAKARRVLIGHHPAFVVADVRAMPLPDAAVDLVYSMGTVEHFPDSDVALREIFRVLRPGGRAIIGVPNKLDPFLRPLMVDVLNRLHLYAYGMERSFTPYAFRRLLEAAGFRVRVVSGILFMPGWLRMLDLWCHTRMPPLTRVTGWLLRPFACLYDRVPALRRHGYLIACVADKPE